MAVEVDVIVQRRTGAVEADDKHAMEESLGRRLLAL